MNGTPRIEPTADGSPTLRHPATGETYHSLRGALGESLHVFIENGLRMVAECGTRDTADDWSVEDLAGITSGSGAGITPPHPVRIFEMGFGTGLNAWLTLKYVLENGITAEYHAVENYPVDTAMAAELHYTDDPLFMELHTAPWNEQVRITPSFVLTKTCGDLTGMEFGTVDGAGYGLVYFDAFAPDVQPELWTEEVFSKLYNAMAPGGILVTYSAKGSVKQALRNAGFRVERLAGALGKRHMLRAVKDI